MKFTRKQALAGAAAGAIGATGIYELVDRLAGSSPPRPVVTSRPPEQHVLDGVQYVRQDGVEVTVPPLHHEIVTATVRADRADLRDAQQEFEALLASIEDGYAASPAGLGMTVAWGLPYFDTFVADAARKTIPHDRRAGVSTLVAARRFPSDPEQTVLEGNHLAILLRSDVRAHVDAAVAQLRASDLIHVTSLRRGFAGGGFGGTRSLPKQMAVAADVPGADLIPETSELFLGFTSTQRAALGAGKIANIETLGINDLRGSTYFREGTHMHLSHVTEDLEAWYVNFAFSERVSSAFRPGLQVKADVQAVAMGPKEVSTVAAVKRQYHESGRIGHSGPIQTTSRLQADVVGPDGTRYPKGAAIPMRADFNTLDNPFHYSDDFEQIQTGAVAGIHFVSFNPSSDDFHRNRLAMDGVMPDGTIHLDARDRAQGFNSILSTTHRQNFLVPPRRHRSFPLAEL